MAAAPPGWRTWSVVVSTETRRDRLGLFRIHEQRKRERRRITVWRQVPSRRNFCKDDDNRAYTVKPIYDALKSLGLVYDDSSAWVERHLHEVIGPDRTTIRVEVLP